MVQKNKQDNKLKMIKAILKTIKSNPLGFLKKASPSRLFRYTKSLIKGDYQLVDKALNNIFDPAVLLVDDSPLDIIANPNKEYPNLNFLSSQQQEILVSIIIPVYNQFDYTYLCLKAILNNTLHIGYEVIVIDDLSSDETKNLDTYVKGIRIIRNSVNQGFLKNCNMGAKEAKGKYLYFLNNDTQVQKDSIKSLLNTFSNIDSVGLVGSKLVFPNGKLQEAGGIVFSNGETRNFGRMDLPIKPEYNYIKEVDYVTGASMMIKKTLWDNIGGFDERYLPAYYEDTDLAFKIRKQGLKVIYQPMSIVVHFEGVSNGKDINKGIKQYQAKNQNTFYHKWIEELKLQPDITEHLNIVRERISKPLVIIVDFQVPTYDQDAGSKSTFQYMEMLLDKGYQLKFIPDNFQKNNPYTQYLQSLGIEVLYGEWYQKNITEWIKENANFISFVYLNRPYTAIKYIDTFKEYTNAKIIFYGHDLHFLRLLREYQLTNNPDTLEEANKAKKMELDLIEKADMSYYPSYVEKEYLLEIDASLNVKDITGFIYENMNKETNFKNRKGILFVGGFKHSPNIDAVLWFINEIYPKIKSQLKIPIYIVGSHPTDEILQLDNSEDIHILGYISEEKLHQIYNQVRIVIVPLRYGAGMKGKVIEAISFGVPIITTTIGAEGLKEASNVLKICDDEKSFANSVVSLHENISELDNISKQMSEYIQNYYSLEAAWNCIKNDFEVKER